MMHLVAIAWLYVALMMALAEASHSGGSLLGAVLTFFLYGLGPLALVLYLMATPARRRAARKRDHAARQNTQPDQDAPDVDSLGQPDGRGHSPVAARGKAIPPVGKEP